MATWRWIGGGNPGKLLGRKILKSLFSELLVNQRRFLFGGGGRQNTPAVDDESDVVDNDDSA